MRSKQALLIISVLLILCGFILLAGRFVFWKQFILLVERFVISDHHLEKSGEQYIQNLLIPLALLHLCIGLAALGLWKSHLHLNSLSFFDPAYTNQSSYGLFSFSSITSLYLYGLYTIPLIVNGIRLPIFNEDAFFENLSCVLYLAASIIMTISSIRVWKQVDTHQKYRVGVILIFILLAGLFFLIGMEEISWGQRIFGWETPAFIKLINSQDETNLHNIVGERGKRHLYFIILLGFDTVLFSGWFFYWEKKKRLLSKFFPHPALFFSAIVLTISSGIHEELFEELAAIFVILYAVWTGLFWKNQGKH